MERFTDNQDGTITDTKTGLAWSQKTIAEDVDHDEALAAVAELGEGWRLPTIEELFALVDHTTQRPAIDTTAFPDTKNDWYWTSTPRAANEAARWVVFFDGGGVLALRRYHDACVRAVRAGQ